MHQSHLLNASEAWSVPKSALEAKQWTAICANNEFSHPLVDLKTLTFLVTAVIL